jgi:hypothetical protein
MSTGSKKETSAHVLSVCAGIRHLTDLIVSTRKAVRSKIFTILFTSRGKMDLQYGIAVTNKYALFIDEDLDPLEILKQKEEEAKTSKKEGDKKTKTKSAKKVASTESKPKQQEQPVVKKEGMCNVCAQILFDRFVVECMLALLSQIKLRHFGTMWVIHMHPWLATRRNEVFKCSVKCL